MNAIQTQQRLRTAGVITLLVGLLGAGLLYWVETRTGNLPADEPISNDFKIQARSTEMYYGKAGLLLEDIESALQRPGVQAAVILCFSATTAIVLFYIASLFTGKSEPPDGSPRPNP